MTHTKQHMASPHTPVLLEEVIELLSPGESQSYLDLTAGYGGHSGAIVDATNNAKGTVLVDRDKNAVEYLHKLEALRESTIINADFMAATNQLYEQGSQFDMILADLGVSSEHLDNVARGFSFKPASLDMRMDQSQELTAAQLLNTANTAKIAKILREYGEEPKSEAIAKAIVEARPISSTDQLEAIVKSVWKGYSRVNPATRTFQAIRIAVNNELGQLESSMPKWIEMLKPGGRIAIISFHSLEDRIVKKILKKNSGDRYDAHLRLLTKKPVTASTNEVVSNPRARSAKLRAAVKIKTF